jgi:hypothetical protein
MSLSIQASDGSVVSTLAMACGCYRVLLAMTLPSLVSDGASMSTLVLACCRVMLLMALPSLASDGAAEMTMVMA